MPEQPYAVFDEEGKVVAAFTKEAFAQTHAAKLRALTSKGEPGRYTPTYTPTYTVAPLMFDTTLTQELEYSATLDMAVNDLGSVADADIQIELTRLTTELDDESMELYDWPNPETYDDERWITLVSYSWDPNIAAARVRAMVGEYLADPLSLEEADDV
jgi:hypothetical protein